MAKVEVGLSAQHIYQDLLEENGFVRKLRATRPKRVWRAWNVNKEDAATCWPIRP